MYQGRKVSKIKRSQQPVFEINRPSLVNTAKKKSHRSATKNGDWQATYSENKKAKRIDRFECREDLGN